MKNKLSVWTWEANPTWYLKRPWEWFKELCWNIRSAHHRIQKGYCDLDWMNFDHWFITIVPQMLRDIADGHGYPGEEPFDTPEKWSAWLNKMADQLDACNEDNENNEYSDEFYKIIDDAAKRNNQSIIDVEFNEEEKEIKDKWYKRSIELIEERESLFQKTMQELLPHWNRLWD